MRFIPHNYQSYAIRFVEEHARAVLLLDMGLGKTVTTLTAIDSLLHDTFDVASVLVVAPLRVAANTWPDEIRKWDELQGLDMAVAVGTAEERRAAIRSGAEITVINRENLTWLLSEFPKARYDMVVYDELSSFKHHNTKRFRAAMILSGRAKRTVGLTGTPAGNGLMDLYAEYKVIDGGKRLGYHIGDYRRRYFIPDKMNGHIVYSYKPVDGAESQIYEKISDITVSMRASDHLQMPEKVSSVYGVKMSGAESRVYKAMKDDLVLTIGEDTEITAANAAALSNKLLQMANGAVYDDEKKVVRIHDRKLDALEDIIEAQNGKPLLVAYWFQHDADRIEGRLKALRIPHARLNSEQAIRRWNKGALPVGLIHPASAGHGLNLQDGGSCLCWYGLTWSLELYDQTNARLYRQGQKNTVVITHIVTEGTLDGRVLKALQGKAQTQDALIDAVKTELGGGTG